MILHTCPKCQTPCLYSLGLDDEVNCHACGANFTLTRFTKTEKDAIVRLLETSRAQLERTRNSRPLVYGLASVVVLVLIWFAVSLFGMIPDEWRAINRRFVRVGREADPPKAVGLVAVGRKTSDGGVLFDEYFTSAAITNDGYMLTSRAVTELEPGQEIWVFIDGRRLQAEIVAADKIADLAVIKVDGDLSLRFRLPPSDPITRLNVEVLALGRSRTDEIQSPAEWPVSVTRGTISLVDSDRLGTQWIEHSAPLVPASRGGPLIMNDRLIGLNVDSAGGIARAVAVAPYRERIPRMIKEWEEHKKRSIPLDLPP